MNIELLTYQIVEKYRLDIAQLYYDNVRENSYYEHYKFEEAYEKIEDLIYHLKNNSCICYGMFHEDAICGFIWAYQHKFREEDRMYISEIRVKEEFRGNGFGKKLLQLVEGRAKELGIGAMYLHAEANNPDAIRLYNTRGYKTERIQLRKEINPSKE